MSHFQHIVVGVDFSDESESALSSAVLLALRWQSRLSVLHVVDDQFSKYWEVLPMPPGELEATLLRETKEKLASQMTSYDLTSVWCEAHVVFGKPFQAIMEYCEQEHADLLVVGQRGANLLERVLLGSTASRLMRHAKIPLLTVHPKHKNSYKRLLVGVDFSEASKAAILFALDFARGLEAELHLLHVGEDLVGEMEQDTEIMESIQRQMEEFLADIDFQGYPHFRHLSSGVAHREIAAFAEAQCCDLIVMGTVGRSGLWGFLAGNTAESVAQIMPCSLMTIQYKS